MTLALSPDDRAALVALARAAVSHRLGAGPAPRIPSGGALSEPRAAFVALWVEDELRAALGELAPARPLAETVAALAARAATEDPRGAPLVAADLPALRLSLAVLGPLRPLSDGPPRPGLDGAAVEQGWHRGVLLPSAAGGKSWSPEVFIKHACLAAGLPARAHLEPGTRVEVFEAEEFGSVITALSIVAAIIAVSLLIVLHEAGHMWVARAMGMRVERFSVGFGPVLWSGTLGETEYVISALPLGGYVKIAGMAASDEIAADDPTAFCNQPAWRRVLVLAAGPGANYLVAVVLAIGLLASVGLPTADGSARVGDLVPGKPAATAGLQPGDRILKVGDVAVGGWKELLAELQRHPGQTVPLQVERAQGSAPLAISITLEDDKGVGRAGFYPFSVLQRRGPVAALLEGFQLTNARLMANLDGLVQLVKREQKAELSGPLGIGQELVRGAKLGADRFFTIVWNVSIALALLNLLPLPALDGGRLVFLVIEVVTRRRVNERIEGIVHAIGFGALVLLLIGVTIFGDLARMLGK